MEEGSSAEGGSAEKEGSSAEGDSAEEESSTDEGSSKEEDSSEDEEARSQSSHGIFHWISSLFDRLFDFYQWIGCKLSNGFDTVGLIWTTVWNAIYKTFTSPPLWPLRWILDKAVWSATAFMVMVFVTALAWRHIRPKLHESFPMAHWFAAPVETRVQPPHPFVQDPESSQNKTHAFINITASVPGAIDQVIRASNLAMDFTHCLQNPRPR